jgi:hypothetical protein
MHVHTYITHSVSKWHLWDQRLSTYFGRNMLRPSSGWWNYACLRDSSAVGPSTASVVFVTHRHFDAYSVVEVMLDSYLIESNLTWWMKSHYMITCDYCDLEIAITHMIQWFVSDSATLNTDRIANSAFCFPTEPYLRVRTVPSRHTGSMEVKLHTS